MEALAAAGVDHLSHLWQQDHLKLALHLANCQRAVQTVRASDDKHLPKQVDMFSQQVNSLCLVSGACLSIVQQYANWEQAL